MISRTLILALLLSLCACTSEDALSLPAVDDQPAPPPAGSATVVLLVRDANGQLVENAMVEPLGVATDEQGRAELSVPADTEVVVRIEKDGYATQVAHIRANDSVVVPTALMPRADPVRLNDASAGGTAAGTQGAKVTVPPGAFVDAAGRPVSGPVDAFLTPVDVTNDRQKGAFPGRYEGIDAAGDQAGLLSYGCTDITFEQNGEELDLAPGVTATIEIPIFVTEHPSGALVTAGDNIPLWSLDETTGIWQYEAEGTVVASVGSPTGFALRGPATHFSWWNCDLDWPSQIWPLVFKFPDNVPLRDVLLIGDVTTGTGSGPRSRVSKSYDPALEQHVLLPTGFDTVLTATAYDGYLQGRTTVVAGDSRDVIEIELVQREGRFLPGERLRGFMAERNEVHTYTFEGLAGETFCFALDAVADVNSPPGPSGTLTGEAVLFDPDGNEIDRETFDADSTADFKQGLPTDGTYRLQITGLNAPGWYLATTRIRPAVPNFAGGVVYLAHGNLYWDADADGTTAPVQVNPPLSGVGDTVEAFAVVPGGGGILYTYKDRSFAPELFLVEKPGQAIKVSDEDDISFGDFGIGNFAFAASADDPKQVLYAVRYSDSSHQTYVVDTDDPGNSTRLGEGALFAQFADGGRKVVYQTDTDPSFLVAAYKPFVVDLDGDNVTQLHSTSETSRGAILAGPNGKVLYTITDNLTKSDLYIVDVDAPGAPVRLNDPMGYPDVAGHSFLPDGRVLYYAGGLYVVDPADPGQRTLINGATDTYVVSPDGDKVAWATLSGVSVADLDDPGVVTELGNLDSKYDHSLAFTPDSASILMVQEDGARHRQLYQVKLATPTERIRLTPAFPGSVQGQGVTDLPDGAWFRFSADGGTVYFITDFEVEEQYDLFLVRLDRPREVEKLNAPLPDGLVLDVQVVE